jgi:uncharacterized coiled-coil protein SlyX
VANGYLALSEIAIVDSGTNSYNRRHPTVGPLTLEVVDMDGFRVDKVLVTRKDRASQPQSIAQMAHQASPPHADQQRATRRDVVIVSDVKILRPSIRLLVTFLVSLATATLPTAAAGQESIASTLGVSDDERGADVLGAFTDSLKLLLIEHGTRIAFQEKTRRELEGNFWTDYRRSVRVPGQWGDTDSWQVNYIGHPIHGAAAGYIWLDHEPAAPANYSGQPEYWSSRARAMAWAAGYSLQFELGPFSEASIGNVGMRRETTGWVDHVVTPLGAFGLIVAEDALDRFLVTKLEGRIRHPLARAVLRLVMNPGRTLSNTAAGRSPWSRDGRPLKWR